MKQKQLSKSDIKEINEQLKKYSIEIGKKQNAMLIETEEGRIIIVDKKPMFFYFGEKQEEKVVPVLRILLENNFLKKAIVDMKAVKFMANGADVMRPGIKEMDDFAANEVISIVDEINKKPICVGITLYGSDEMKQMDKGRVIKTIHYVGDKIWNFSI